MDFAKFSDDNFDMKDWINNALRVQKDIPVDAHTSNLVMKLQLFIQEVSKSLEETSQVALNNIPRVLREVETIKTEVSLLKNQMTIVKDDIRKIEESTAHSMKRLVDVDQVKVRMQSASNALQEADKWSTLSLEVNEYFYTGDTHQVANKLIGMQNSLQVLQDVPDYTERYRMLENLKNRLEALLSTKLVQTFNNHDLDDAKYYVDVFSQLDRLSQLQTYYNNCHKSSLTQTWAEIRDDPNKIIVTWLPIFFDHLLALWHREVTWCGQVFPQPVQALCSLLAQTLSSLNPSIQHCIQDALNDEENPLELLIQLQTITTRFTQSLEKAIQTFQGLPSIADNSSSFQLITIVQTPYQSYLLQYSSLQQTTLLQIVDEIPTDSSDLSDTAENMMDSVSKAFRAADEALDSCLKFTNGYGAASLLESLQVFFSAYFGRLDSILVDLRKHCTLDNDLPPNHDDSANQWTNFQYAFKIIEMCGVMILKMDNFQQHLSVELLMVLETIVPSGEPNKNYLKTTRPMEWDKVVELHERLLEYGIDAILPIVLDNISKLNEHAHKFAFDIVFIHLKRQLNALPNLKIWWESEHEAIDGELPTFSLSPLGYITYVGDSLLTLPQQLEPFFVQENHSLITALKAGKIPFQENEDSSGAHYDHHWLESFAHGTISVFTENVLKIKQITAHATRQLLADMEYFFNILSALEIQPSKDITTIKQLLEAPSQSFLETAEEIPADPNIVRSITKLRNVEV